jgi:hypothetical protein
MTKTSNAPKMSPAAAAINEALEIGSVLVDTKCTWALDCRVVSLTGLNGSEKSITVRELGDKARDQDLIINRRSLGSYRIA